MNITVALVQQYGQQAIHPRCENSRTLAQLAGTKTITPHALDLIKKLGYVVNVQQTLPALL